MNGSLQTAVKLHWMCVLSPSVRPSMSLDLIYMFCFIKTKLVKVLLYILHIHFMVSSISVIVLRRQSGKVLWCHSRCLRKLEHFIS